MTAKLSTWANPVPDTPRTSKAVIACGVGRTGDAVTRGATRPSCTVARVWPSYLDCWRPCWTRDLVLVPRQQIALRDPRSEPQWAVARGFLAGPTGRPRPSAVDGLLA